MNLSQDDADTKMFVNKMELNGIRWKTMIISNTQSANTVAAAYHHHPKENTVGLDESEDIVEKIVCFGKLNCIEIRSYNSMLFIMCGFIFSHRID